jgi:hypothetical protein
MLHGHYGPGDTPGSFEFFSEATPYTGQMGGFDIVVEPKSGTTSFPTGFQDDTKQLSFPSNMKFSDNSTTRTFSFDSVPGTSSP